VLMTSPRPLRPNGHAHGQQGPEGKSPLASFFGFVGFAVSWSFSFPLFFSFCFGGKTSKHGTALAPNIVLRDQVVQTDRLLRPVLFCGPFSR